MVSLINMRLSQKHFVRNTKKNYLFIKQNLNEIIGVS